MGLRGKISLLIVVMHVFYAATTLYIDNTMPSAYFLIFSASSLFMLFASTVLCENIVINFFAIFMYLGFFVKVCSHAVFSYPFIEPIGDFAGSPSEWIEFFTVASVGAIAIGLCAILVRYLDARITKPAVISQKLFFPQFKKHILKYFLALVSAILIIAYINIWLGITISGVAAATVLFWPLNAIIGFSFYMGFCILVCLFGQHEFVLTQRLRYTYFLVFIEAFVSSIAILSRGTFLFHFIPFFLCILVFRRELKVSFSRILTVLVFGVVSFVLSGFLVTNARSRLYDGYVLNKSNYTGKNLFTINDYSKVGLAATQMSGLIVDRWIGAEGLMAVISYPEKSAGLIYQSLMRNPKVGEKDIFEQMNKSFYPISNKYTFTSLPGPVAFFYYSGSIMLVFVGIFFFVFLLYALQRAVLILIPNIFVQYQTAFFFAVSFMQFGISPRPLVVSFTMLFFLLGCIWVLNSRLFQNKKENVLIEL